MKFVRSHIAKERFAKVEPFGQRFIVRVNPEDLDEGLVVFDECITTEEPTEDLYASIAEAARENNERVQKAAERANIAYEIRQCKAELSALDYKSIKRLQGELSDEEWQDVCSACKQLRDRINTAESNLAAMDAQRNADSGVQ